MFALRKFKLAKTRCHKNWTNLLMRKNYDRFFVFLKLKFRDHKIFSLAVSKICPRALPKSFWFLVAKVKANLPFGFTLVIALF